MHRFQLDITPPKPGSAASKLTPTAWLLSSTMLDILGEKDLHIYREEQTSLSLDPAPSPTDSSITTYHERVAEILPTDRKKLAVTIPADNLMERIRVSTSHSLPNHFSLFTQLLLTLYPTTSHSLPNYCSLFTQLLPTFYPNLCTNY